MKVCVLALRPVFLYSIRGSFVLGPDVFFPTPPFFRDGTFQHLVNHRNHAIFSPPWE